MCHFGHVWGVGCTHYTRLAGVTSLTLVVRREGALGGFSIDVAHGGRIHMHTRTSIYRGGHLNVCSTNQHMCGEGEIISV